MVRHSSRRWSTPLSPPGRRFGPGVPRRRQLSVRLPGFGQRRHHRQGPGSGDGRRSGDRRRNTGALGHGERHRLRLRCVAPGGQGDRDPRHDADLGDHEAHRAARRRGLVRQRMGRRCGPQASATVTAGEALVDDRIDADSRSSLLPSQTLRSSGGSATLAVDAEYGLALRDAGGKLLWSSHPDGVSQTPVRARATPAGVVLTGRDGSVLWEAGTGENGASGASGLALRERNGTTLVLTSATGKWSAPSTTGADRPSCAPLSEGAHDRRPMRSLLKSGNLGLGRFAGPDGVSALVLRADRRSGSAVGAGDLGDQWPSRRACSSGRHASSHHRRRAVTLT